MTLGCNNFYRHKQRSGTDYGLHLLSQIQTHEWLWDDPFTFCHRVADGLARNKWPWTLTLTRTEIFGRDTEHLCQLSWKPDSYFFRETTISQRSSVTNQQTNERTGGGNAAIIMIFHWIPQPFCYRQACVQKTMNTVNVHNIDDKIAVFQTAAFLRQC